MMNWKTARKISNKTFALGAGWENKISQMILLLLSKEDDSVNIDVVLLLSYLEQELDKIAAEQIAALDNITDLAYRYAMAATLDELDDIGFTIPSLAIGYNKSWLGDGKDYSNRVLINMKNAKSRIQGLLLGYQGNNPTVLMGLLSDELKKIDNEWKRLLRTEIEACYSQGARDANLMKGALTAVIENGSPCDAICAQYVGEHEVPLNGRLGIDLPPYHPNCRCVFLGVFGQGR